MNIHNDLMYEYNKGEHRIIRKAFSFLHNCVRKFFSTRIAGLMSKSFIKCTSFVAIYFYSRLHMFLFMTLIISAFLYDDFFFRVLVENLPLSIYTILLYLFVKYCVDILLSPIYDEKEHGEFSFLDYYIRNDLLIYYDRITLDLIGNNRQFFEEKCKTYTSFISLGPEEVYLRVNQYFNTNYRIPPLIKK